MTNEIEEPKKPLNRDQILKAVTPPKVYKLPSGKTVSVQYLSVLMVRDIEKSLESVAEGNIERKFTEKVIEWMLRENDQKEFQAFPIEDQHRLIEIAVEEWGCDEEYELLADIKNPEERFYQAVRQQEKELAREFSESIKGVTASLASAMSPLKSIQVEIASSAKGILDLYSKATPVSDAVNKINIRILDQMRDINAFSTPIIEMVEKIASMQRSSVIPFEKTLLESFGGTISSYQNLMKDVLPIERFSALPDSVRYYPTIEMHNTSIVAGRFVMKDIDQPADNIITPENTELLAWLGSLDPSFPTMLLGAEQTINSQNPDHCRHFASSHRELSTHILHLLAPDDLVKQWTKDSNFFDKEGKPTRRARLKYIARNHSNESFIDFVIKDFENQMALLNADEHRKAQEHTNQELSTLHMRFLSMLGFLMQIVSSRS